ncbi:cytochrome P450 [Ascobolus immersus RN42]|uniref:Cytochrome P450 n=1 Tax=Ascobolus immersus RN42 TaxID=1160509 RepID=A0A3N4IXP4_ASCIM|nr:cytochrome P450 [Ascobolus immersus RN42]
MKDLFLLTGHPIVLDLYRAYQSITAQHSIFTIAATAFITYFTVYVIYQVYFHPLAHIPGPFLCKISDLGFLFKYYSNREWEKDMELFEKYGPVVRVSPTCVAFSDPAWTPLVYHSKADRTDHYRSFDQYFGIFAIIPHKEHADVRKKIGGAYTKAAVKKMLPAFQKRINRWCNNIGDEYADTGKVFDFYPWVSYLTTDVLTEQCFGTSLDISGMRADPNRVTQSLEDAMFELGTMQRWPLLRNIFWGTPIHKFFTPKPTDKSGLGILQNVANQFLPDRLANPTDAHDLLNVLIAARTDPKTGEVDRERLDKDVVLTIAAGLDTGAGAIRNCVVLTVETPGVLQWLEAGNFSDRHINAICVEGQRLHNTSQSAFPRVVQDGGVQLGPYHIPGGTEAYIQGSAPGRSKKLFGDDVDVFRPQRWFEMTDQEWAHKERQLFVWGAGTRICIGRYFAEYEMMLFLRAFFQEFEVILHHVGERYWQNLMFYDGGIQMELKRKRKGPPLEERPEHIVVDLRP